ncbi:MAG: proline--tRNA ligase [Candidatus Babeliales bacterium]
MSKLPDIKTNFSEWYNEVIYQSEMADHSPVRGCIVIRPYGFAMWEIIRDYVDGRLKATGHQNAAFPLLIPESFLKKEAKHVEGFSPELAVVTHAGGKEIEEPYVVRPTSETIIHYMFARWMKSYRDLPIKINQWANVVRWEMRPRPFLRTTEFFWQEGHTAHETHEQAQEEALLILNEYITLAEQYLAIPVVAGKKSEAEKFPGADVTYTFEGLMQDGKALQMGTSHIISQTFAHAFDMKFQDREGNLAYPFLTSWAVTTRLLGAVIMTHGDAKGLVLPPQVAPIQVVIIPIFGKNDDRNAVMDAVAKIQKDLGALRVYVDADDQKTPGAKFYHWELKGVPLRIEIGTRDLAQQQAMVADRIGLGKKAVALNELATYVPTLLETIQRTLLERARERRDSMWHRRAKLAEFASDLVEHNGFYQTGWCRNPACEALLKQYQATTRCLLEERTFETCFNCDQKSQGDVLIAKAY